MLHTTPSLGATASMRPAGRNAPPQPAAPALTIVTTPHPTTAFSHDIEGDIAAKLQRNRDHRYDTPDAVRRKHERYLDKRVAFITGLRRGNLPWPQDGPPADSRLSAKALARLQDSCERGVFAPPTVVEESTRMLRQIQNLVDAFYRLACQPDAEAQAACAAFRQPRTWASRDNDRSSVVFGDHAAVFAAQVAGCCSVYQRLLDDAAERSPLLDIPGLRQRLDTCADIAGRLGALVRRAQGDPVRLQDELAAFFGHPEDRLALHDRALRSLCAAQPDAAFSRTFARLGLGGFAGEVRVNAAGLRTDASAAERRRIHEILREIRLLHAGFPDVRSIVIAEFSHLEEFRRLWVLMMREGVHMEVIPLLESPAAVDYFIGHRAEFARLAVTVVMLAGSDLGREAGTVQATVQRWRMNAACAEDGLVPYQGIGTSIRRSGVGLGPVLAGQLLPRLFHPPRPGGPQEQRYTMQGGDAAAALANPTLAAGFVLRRTALLRPAAAATAAQAAHALAVFAPITAAEQAMRPVDSPFADFYRAHPVIRDMRNASVHHGARDRPKPALAHLYEDRAINADASTEFFGLAAYAWAGLAEPSGMLQRMVSATRGALADGNGVVADIVLNYALQARTLYFEAQCLAKWRAADLLPSAVEQLRAGRSALLAFLAGVDHDLACRLPLQQQVMDYLGIEAAFDPARPYDNLQRIEQRRHRCNKAGIAALRALRERDRPDLSPAAQRLAALDLHLQLTTAYLLGAGVKS